MSSPPITLEAEAAATPLPVQPQHGCAAWCERCFRGMRTGIAHEEAFVDRYHTHPENIPASEMTRFMIHRTVAHKHLGQPAGGPAAPRRMRWRQVLGEVMENHYTQLLLLVLVIADVVAVFGELMLNYVCEAHPEEATDAKREHWVHGLGIFSETVLFILLFHLVLLLVAFGRAFFKKIWYLLDVVVVVVAIALELGLHDPEGGLLPVLLSWRIVRVLHGFMASTETEHHEFKQQLLEVLALHRRLEQEATLAATRARLHEYRLAIRTVNQWRRFMRAKRAARNEAATPVVDPPAHLFAHPSAAPVQVVVEEALTSPLTR